MSKTIEEILTPKPEAHPHIYGLLFLSRCIRHAPVLATHAASQCRPHTALLETESISRT